VSIDDLFRHDSILLDEPDDAMPLHDREYRVRAFRLARDRLLIKGAVRDQKPPHLYIRADDEPITVHHMRVDLTLSFPELVILEVDTHIDMHPRDECPSITAHYDKLVGLSIARGFTHKVRELFGGPRGCTHTTALLQAMGPVAMQCFWSMKAATATLQGEPEPMLDPDRHEDNLWHKSIDTCHVWRADGEPVAARAAGIPEPAPVFLRRRAAELGITLPGYSDS
jgi:Protein of unknown function (DUF2889)